MAHVLLIEDDPDVTRLLKVALIKHSYNISCVDNGRSGISLLKKMIPAPDIIITDILMPVQEGIETIMEIRSLNKEIPILAISGGGRTKRLDFLQTAERLGANAALAKPFRLTELVEMIEKLLAARVAPS